MVHKFLSSLGLLLAFIAGNCRAQSDGTPPKLDSTAQGPLERSTSFDQTLYMLAYNLAHEYNVPGMAIAIIRDGKVVRIECVGFANVLARKPVTKRTVFNIGSISKMVAAWGFMQLVEQKSLGLDDPVKNYLSRWKLPASNFNDSGVTLRRLLSHTAGLSVHGYAGYQAGQRLPSLEDSLSGAEPGKNVRIEVTPGSKWEYSGGGYTLLQLLLEERTKREFGPYMKAKVLLPLRMRSSDFRWTPQLVAASATPYDENGKPIRRRSFTESAAAGLQTTVVDLARFAEASLSRDPKILAKVLMPQTVQLMQNSVPPASKDGESGLGYQIMRYGGLETIGHTGENAGWTASVFLHASSKSGIVMVTNSSNGLKAMIPLYSRWAETVKASLTQHSEHGSP